MALNNNEKVIYENVRKCDLRNDDRNAVLDKSNKNIYRGWHDEYNVYQNSSYLNHREIYPISLIFQQQQGNLS